MTLVLKQDRIHVQAEFASLLCAYVVAAFILAVYTLRWKVAALVQVAEARAEQAEAEARRQSTALTDALTAQKNLSNDLQVQWPYGIMCRSITYLVVVAMVPPELEPLLRACSCESGLPAHAGSALCLAT